jgi:hypothetical protein
LSGSKCNQSFFSCHRESKRHAEESGLGEDDGDLEELTQPPSGLVSGWIGTPDPRKYAPGTTYLSPSELQAEIEAGNVVALEDWGKALDDLEPWERHMLRQAMAADFAKYRCILVKCMRKFDRTKRAVLQLHQ